jgi:hypothetical protein
METQSAQKRAQRCLNEDGYVIVCSVEAFPPGTVIQDVDDRGGEPVGTMVVIDRATEEEFVSQSLRMGGTGETQPPFIHFLKCTAE